MTDCLNCYSAKVNSFKKVHFYGRRWKLLAMLFFTCSLFSSCNYFKLLIGMGPKRPEVKLSQIELTKITLEHIDMQLQFEVTNPNNDAIKLMHMDYKLKADQELFGEGSMDKQVDLPAQKMQKVMIPLKLTSQQAMKLGAELLLNRRDIQAEVEAKLTFDSVFGPLDVNFNEKKKFKDLLKIHR